METLIIQVDCHNRNGPPQLGITVEAPISQKHKITASINRRHDYQNLDLLLDGREEENDSKTTSASHKKTKDNRPNSNNASSQQTKEGLQITEIQRGSVIDRNGQFRIGDIIVEVNGVNLQRPFVEAQRTLKQFVLDHTSHGPLILKVLRRAPSSSSLPSTTGSQSTVIERTSVSRRSDVDNQTEIRKPDKSMKNHLNPTSPKSSSSSARASRHLVGALNTRKIGTKHRIQLRKSACGFGIKIAERDNMYGANKPIYVTAITTSGSAYLDGRLKEGDMLLEVNDIDLTGKSQLEVTKMLKSVKVDELVEFVISRQEDVPDEASYSEQSITEDTQHTNGNHDSSKSLIDLDVLDKDDSVFFDGNEQKFDQKMDRIIDTKTRDGPGIHVYDIPLNDTKSAGLGLYLKYPTRTNDRKDLGIWIESVITGGAAWKDGRLMTDDQILAVNGINLSGLPNAKETLTAAVCRNIGPEATASIIRLKIQRRDQATAAKILHGTNNRIEHSDMPYHEKSHQTSDRIENSRDSYNHHASSLSTSATTSSSDSARQYSREDSALSPQTQASNSLRLSNSCNEIKLNQDSSGKTNDTSSSISQITDFTTLQGVISDGQMNEGISTITLPKSIDMREDYRQTHDHSSSAQSWDDESLDAGAGEDPFQRDGFGRQSISEKRHVELIANTDTFKRKQKIREKKERQQKLEEQFARQRLNDADNDHIDSLLNDHNLMKTNFYERESHPKPRADDSVVYLDTPATQSHHRELPIDVHLPNGSNLGVTAAPIRPKQYAYHTILHNNYGDRDVERVTGTQIIASNEHRHSSRAMAPIPCANCGLVGGCVCVPHNMMTRTANQGFDPQYDPAILKRSNSLESIQQHHIREGLVVPRSGTVRVARNRKVNESFRAAVDRSYDSGTNDSVGKNDRSDNSDYRRSLAGSKVTSSIANSTISTSNEERCLIRNNDGNNGVGTHKKSLSLFGKILKFGSMKKKKKNRENSSSSSKSIEVKVLQKDISSRDPETNRSQSSKGFHSRTQSTQSHPSSVGNKHDHDIRQHQHPSSGQMYGISPLRQNHANDFNPNSNRLSMPTCQSQGHIHDYNTHNQNLAHITHMATLKKSKYHPNMSPVMNHNRQYSNVFMNSQQLQSHHPQQSPIQVPAQFPTHITTMGMHNPYTYAQHFPANQNFNGSMVNGYQHGHSTLPLSSAATGQQHWHAPVHAPSGLWVTNTAPTDQNFYAKVKQSLGQQHNDNGSGLQSHSGPACIPPVVLPNDMASRNHHQQSPLVVPPLHHNAVYLNGHHQHHQSVQNNHQPQPIYYYDF